MNTKLLKLFGHTAMCALLASVWLSPAPVFAQTGVGFSGTGVTNATGPFVTTNGQYYVISGQIGSGTPYVTFLEASFKGSDVSNATTVVNWYQPTRDYPVTAAAAAAGTTITSSTNGLVANDVLVLWTRLGDTYQRLTVASLSGSVITVNETIVNAQTTKDVAYKMAVRGRVFGGNSISPNTFNRDKVTIGPSMGPAFVGLAGKPHLVEVQGTNSPTLNVVSGRFGF